MPQTAEIQDLKRIFFSASSVRALQAGEKSQTRRLVKPDPGRRVLTMNASGNARGADREGIDPDSPTWEPSYPPGTYLVAEPLVKSDGQNVGFIEYESDGKYASGFGSFLGWSWDPDRLPSIFCPKHCCRYKIEVTSVRVERLGDISGKDCLAEGITEDGIHLNMPAANALLRSRFSDSWNDLHGEGSWEEDKERQVFVHDLGPIQRLDCD